MVMDHIQEELRVLQKRVEELTVLLKLLHAR
jgi:hypothetical protein